MAAREGHVSVKGGRLYVREIGSGPPVVVLHGGPDFNHNYLLPELDELASAFRLIYYDQRGRGRSSADVSADEITIESEVDDLDRLREHFGLGELSLLGHSWGSVLAMRGHKSGSIVCLSSVSAQRGGGIFGGPHYSAAKAGVLGLGKAMARELGPDNVRVNSVTPGLIQTDITGGKLTPELKVEILKGIPLNRLGDATDVANCCLFLASDLSSYLTGITLDVNGGMLIH